MSRCMAVVRMCWLWALVLMGACFSLPIVALYDAQVSVIVAMVFLAVLVSTIPLMMSYVTSSIRMGKPLSVVSRRKLVECVGRDRYIFVGEGWSFWLNYTRPLRDRAIISMPRSYAGVIEISGSCVICRSGTHFDVLQKALRTRGLTLEDRSQLDNMTVGGALKTDAHGCSKRVRFSELLLRLTYVVQGSTDVLSIEGGDSRMSAICRDPKVILLDVSLRTVPDHAVVLVNREHSTPYEFDWNWYEKAAYAMIFVGAFEFRAKLGLSEEVGAGLLGVKTPLRLETLRHQAHIRKQYMRQIALSEVHSYVQHIDILEALMIPLLQYINFELFVRGVTMHALAPALQMFHERFQGRTELRQCRQIVAIDVALHGPNKSNAVNALARMLHAEFNIRVVALHRGKYRFARLPPLRLVEYEAL